MALPKKSKKRTKERELRGPVKCSVRANRGTVIERLKEANNRIISLELYLKSSHRHHTECHQAAKKSCVAGEKALN